MQSISKIGPVAALAVGIAIVLAPPTLTTPANAQSVACGQPYTVARGDSLSGISLRAYGTLDFARLYAVNRAQIGPNPNTLSVGQVIDIPCPADADADADAALAAAAGVDDTVPVDVPPPQDAATAAADGSGGADDLSEDDAIPEVAEDAAEDGAEADAGNDDQGGDASIPDVAAPDGPDGAEIAPAAAGDGPDADGPVTLTFSRASAPGFVVNTSIIDLYLAEIEAATEGRVRFADPESPVRDHAAQYDLVVSGEVDGAYVLNTTIADTHPLLQLPMLPLMGGAAEQTAVSLWRLHDEYLSRTDYFDEAQVMGFIASPSAHIWREASDPVTATEGVLAKNDYAVPYFLGLDVRGPAALRDEVADWLLAYRATHDEPPTLFMAHGAVRAVGLWPGDFELLATEIDYGVYTPTFTVILSNDAWDRISEEDQAAIRAVSGEALARRSASWDAFDAGFRSDMLVNGLNFVKADDFFLGVLETHTQKMLREAWIPLADAMGISGADAVRSYREDLRSMEDLLIFR